MSKARRWAAKGVKGGGTKEVVRRLTPFEEVGSEGGRGGPPNDPCSNVKLL